MDPETEPSHGPFPNTASFSSPSTHSPILPVMEKPVSRRLVEEKKENKGLNEGRNESWVENHESQTFIPKKQKTMDETEVVLGKLRRRGFRRFRYKASSATPSLKIPDDALLDYRSKNLPSPLLSTFPPVFETDRLHHQQSPDSSGLYCDQLDSSRRPVRNINTEGEVEERGDHALPTTTIQCDPNIEKSHHSSLPESLYEMYARGYSSPGPTSAQRSADPTRHSLKTELELGRPTFSYLDPCSSQSTGSSFSAGYDADSCEKTGDPTQAVKKELIEDRNESWIKIQGSQTSIPEKQLTANEKFSEEGVERELQCRNFHSKPDNSNYPPTQSVHGYKAGISQPEICLSNKYHMKNYGRPRLQASTSDFPDDSLDPPTPSTPTETQILKYPLPPAKGTLLFSSDQAGFNWNVRRPFEPMEETYNLFPFPSPVQSFPEIQCSSSGYFERSGACDLGDLSFRRGTIFASSSSIDSSDDSLKLTQHGALTETGIIENPSPAATATPAVTQDTTREPGPDPIVAGPPCSQGRSGVLSSDLSEPLFVQSDWEAGNDSDTPMERKASVTAVNSSVTNTLPAHPHLQSFSDSVWRKRDSGCLPRSHSVPSLSQIPSTSNKTFTRANSLPDMFKTSIKEFAPDIDEDDETFRFQSSCPGLYQCSVTGLVFHMDGEGDVVYRIVPWNRRLLARHHKRPAGPRFDIKCLQQSVRQLHLPHCEIRSTGGCDSLSVAHEDDEGIEFIAPHEITETHVIINITGFSAFGNVKDEDSPPDPVRALVLLFYSPPVDPDVDFFLNVLLLPQNIVLWDVLRTRRKLFGDGCFIQTSPQCKLHPEQEYTLSTFPEDDSILVQPTEAEFVCENYDNYFPTFQVSWETMRKHIKLLLRESKSSHSVWERRVCLSSTGVRRSCGSSALNLPSSVMLFEVRSSFVNGISGPVLKSLLDKLLEKKVMTDSERESVDGIQNHRDKARFVIDTVRKKGDAASSEMIEFLCEMDPFLCEHLGLL